MDSINILESYTAVITRGDIANCSSGKRAWISGDGLNFQEAHFPKRIFNSFFLKTLKEKMAGYLSACSNPKEGSLKGLGIKIMFLIPLALT